MFIVGLVLVVSLILLIVYLIILYYCNKAEYERDLKFLYPYLKDNKKED